MIKRFFYFVIIILTVESCSVLPFGKSNPSARNPGSTSTTTNLDYFSDASAEEEEGRGLEGQGGRSAGAGEEEGHACHANAGGAQLRIRAELGPRPTGMQNGLDFVCRPICNRNKKTAF